MRLLFALLILSGFCFAQDLTTLASSKAVSSEIDRAVSQVFISSSSVYVDDIAQSLHRAVLRGVRVRMLIDPQRANDSNSYIGVFDLLQWAFGKSLPGEKRVAPYDPQRIVIRALSEPPNLLLVDNTTVIQGPYVARADLRFDDGKTYVSRDSNLYTRRFSEFSASWRSAVPFESVKFRYFSIDE